MTRMEKLLYLVLARQGVPPDVVDHWMQHSGKNLKELLNMGLLPTGKITFGDPARSATKKKTRRRRGI